MHSVAQRPEMPLMEFPHHPHARHVPRRGNTTTALDTQNIDNMKHHHQSQSQSHMRVNSLSSGGSLSDYSTILRTPQDSVQSENDAIIAKQQDDNQAINAANGWKPSVGMVQEQLTSSPIDETFSRGPSQAGGKPMPMQINTSFVPRSRPMAYSAHPNQKTTAPTGASQHNAPQSATAAFPPMQLPTVASTAAVAGGATPASATANNVSGRHGAPFMGRGLGVGQEAKVSDGLRQQQQYNGYHHPGQGQHRRTQSAPLLSLSPLAPVASSPTEIQNNNNNPHSPPANSNGFGGAARLSYPQQQPQQDFPSSQPSNYPQLNPMATAVPAASFTPFPAMSPFQASLQAVPPLMWSPFFQQTAPGGFYSQRPPQAPPGPPMPSATTNPVYSPQPVVPATTQWKINPNSQPQMPLSHLINQAQGLLIGGPSAHNRKIGLYKTEICRNWEEKQSCRYGVKCQFAHGTQDVRTVPRHPKYKTEICRTFWVTGSCPYGKRCCFIHPTATSQQGPLSPNGPPLSGGMNGNAPSQGMDDTERETQHAISLLARLDIKRGSPDQFNGNGSNARQTPDSNISDPSAFVYPGLHLNGHSNVDAERSSSVPRI